MAGRFEEPTDVGVDPTNGTILVADSWNGRIQRFGADLEYQSEFAVPGWAGRDIYQKPSLAVGVDGTIYATDPATGQVVAYDPTGQVKYAVRRHRYRHEPTGPAQRHPRRPGGRQPGGGGWGEQSGDGAFRWLNSHV